jgi:hypothetical protein
LFSIDKDYFYEIGSYDEGMDIWGELALLWNTFEEKLISVIFVRRRESGDEFSRKYECNFALQHSLNALDSTGRFGNAAGF